MDDTFFPAIAVKNKSADTMSVYDMTPFQDLDEGDELKVLSDEDYEKLKESIIENGIYLPFEIWKHNGKNFIIDGHQKVKTLRKMRGEGYEIPDVPVSFVECDSIQEAKQKVLYATTMYGKMSEDTTLRFTEQANLKADEVFKNFVSPAIDTKKLLKNLDKTVEDAKKAADKATEGVKGKTKEDSTGQSKMVHTCPECGHNFSAKSSIKK